MEQLETIKENAELVRTGFSKFLNIRLNYDEESVELIAGYIDRNRNSFDEETIQGLTNTFGAFIGECVRHNFGGVWKIDENGFGIAFDDKNIAYPFARVEKHLRNGHEDSIIGFYNLIPTIFKK